MEPVLSAIEQMGGQAAAARTLGVSAGLVWQWTKNRRPVGPDHCPAIERDTTIRCEQLRPDLIWTRDNSGRVTGYHVPLSAA